MKNLRAQLLSVVLVVAGSGAAFACIWDDDTLRMETRDLPAVVDVIAGRFPRHPSLYYERRLEIARKRIEADPDALGAYDNAGVACDRLGDGDGAIAWMARKGVRLEALARVEGGAPPGDLEAHRYRHAANLGTFHAHRWVRGGADRSDTTDLKTARDLIARAIELNPDAHFGRERYQLRAIEWLLEVPPYRAAAEGSGTGELGDFLGLQEKHWVATESGEGRLEKEGIGDAVRGLSGLIVLGNAWESVDVFHALALALALDGRNSVAFLARLRIEEIVRAGGRSLRPGAPEGDALLQALWQPHLLRDGRQESLREEFTERRRDARDWLSGYHGQVLRRLREGRHPDTDPTFFDGIE